MSFNLGKYNIHNMITNRNNEQSAISEMIKYNCLENEMFKLADKIYDLEYKAELNRDYNFRIYLEDVFGKEGFDNYTLVILWEFLVIMFGDYFASPKTGWIELSEFENCANYICDMCADIDTLFYSDFNINQYPLVKAYYNKKYNFEKE